MIYTLDQIRNTITPIAEKYRIPAVYLFGSYARGTATEDSDIDLLIDTTGVNLRGFEWGGLYNDFDEAFEKSIDMVTLHSLDQNVRRQSQIHFRENVLRERKQIYAIT